MSVVVECKICWGISENAVGKRRNRIVMRLGERIRRWGAEQASMKQKITVSKLRHREYRWQRPFRERQSQAVPAPERGYDARAVADDNLSVVSKALNVADRVRGAAAVE